MAFEKPILINGFKASSDMSAASQQYMIVEFDSSGNVKPADAATDKPVGILQNLPQVNETAEVLMLGISKVRVGSTDVAVGDLIATDSTGRAAACVPGAGSASFVIGRVISIDNADNDAALVTCAINCLAIGRAY